MAIRWSDIRQGITKNLPYLINLIGLSILFSSLYGITRLWKTTLCPFRRFFGIPCPGCGLTRGLIALFSGDYIAATRFHVFSVPIFLGILFYASGVLLGIFRNKDYIRKLNEILCKRQLLILYPFVFVLGLILNYFV